MKLIFDFNSELAVDWWMITKEWFTGTEERPIEHRTIWWFQDYDEARQAFNDLEELDDLERQRIWEKDGRIVFIVSRGKDSEFIEKGEKNHGK